MKQHRLDYNPPLYVFDIDGVLSSPEEYLHYIKTSPKQWHKFFDNILNYKPIPSMIEMVKSLSSWSVVVFQTGRPEEYRKHTQYWFSNQGLSYSYNKLYMRKNGDHRPNVDVKVDHLNQILEDFPHHYPVVWFEDSPAVVKEISRRGVFALSTEHNFASEEIAKTVGHLYEIPFHDSSDESCQGC